MWFLARTARSLVTFLDDMGVDESVFCYVTTRRIEHDRRYKSTHEFVNNFCKPATISSLG